MSSSETPVFSSIKSAAVKRWFPFVRDAAEGDDPTGVLVASEFNPRVMGFLRNGGRVLLLAESGRFGGRTTYLPSSFGGAQGLRIDTSHRHCADSERRFSRLAVLQLDGRKHQFRAQSGAGAYRGGLRMTRRPRDNVLSRAYFLSKPRQEREIAVLWSECSSQS